MAGRESAVTVERKGNTCRVYLSRGASSGAVNLSISVDSTGRFFGGDGTQKKQPLEVARRRHHPNRWGKKGRERSNEERKRRKSHIHTGRVYMAVISEALLSLPSLAGVTCSSISGTEKSLTVLFFECRIGTAGRWPRERERARARALVIRRYRARDR